LRLCLLTLRQIERVSLTEDLPSALRVLAEEEPSLVLVDSALPGDQVLAVVQQIKAHRPDSRVLALADEKSQQRAATAAGADAAHLLGLPAERLFETIEELLDGQSASAAQPAAE
jgi:DNA-binding NarL/FixJ family response regulator